MTKDVLVIDSHRLYLDALTQMIGQMPGLRVTATATDVTEALRRPQVRQFDLAIIGIRAVGEELEAIRAFKRMSPRTRIVLLINTPESFRKVFRLEALGYVLTTDGKREFESAIHYAMEGIPYYSEQIALELTRMSSLGGDVPAGELDPEEAHLTKREREIIHLVAGGYSSWQIGELLCISPMTVNTHRRNLMRKLGVRNALGLVKYALESPAAEGVGFSSVL